MEVSFIIYLLHVTPILFFVVAFINILVLVWLLFRSSSLVEQALQISLQFLKGNWVRTCRLTLELPPLCAAVMAAYHLPRVRRYTTLSS